ncbi:hypothetical protein Agub_g5297 [Astrephomene gubernaculifera]|uniref:Protein kinase domain-containing protein n=1 Tax=Astrephomene gubernaculifera TaxID=47775 RepID=A0AAD3HKL4_9CHLO|nr:hypothetical protein Agub_g5297 [Astrephomene gubernaculifera]
MGNILCLSGQTDAGLAAISKDIPVQPTKEPLTQSSRHSNIPCLEVIGISGRTIDDEEEGRKLEMGDLSHQGCPSAANSSSQHLLITTNSLIPPTPVGTENVIFQSPEQMMEDVQLLEPIGSGGFAIVYRGVYQGGDVAVKIAVTNTVDRSGLREALVSPQLRHPHVVQTYVTRGAMLTAEHIEEVYGSAGSAAPATRRQLQSLSSTVSEDGLGAPRKASHEQQDWREVLLRMGATPDRCLVMLVQELCEVGSLARAIRQGIFKSRAAVRSDLVARRVLLRTAAEICRGMIHLHSASVVHGDLKPANVLLARSRADRRGFVAKVADFGLSHLLQSGASRVESASWGTVSYASPESFNGTHSKSSDVYSFGVLLWEMLTAKRPYESHTAVQIMMGVSLQGLRPEWPEAEWPELCALGARCLAQQPQQRPSFRQLERELVALEEGLREESIRRSAERSRPSASQQGQGQGQGQGQQPGLSSQELTPRASLELQPLRDGIAAGGSGGGGSCRGGKKPPAERAVSSDKGGGGDGGVSSLPALPSTPGVPEAAAAAASPLLQRLRMHGGGSGGGDSSGVAGSGDDSKGGVYGRGGGDAAAARSTCCDLTDKELAQLGDYRCSPDADVVVRGGFATDYGSAGKALGCSTGGVDKGTAATAAVAAVAPASSDANGSHPSVADICGASLLYVSPTAAGTAAASGNAAGTATKDTLVDPCAASATPTSTSTTPITTAIAGAAPPAADPAPVALSEQEARGTRAAVAAPVWGVYGKPSTSWDSSVVRCSYNGSHGNGQASCLKGKHGGQEVRAMEESPPLWAASASSASSAAVNAKGRVTHGSPPPATNRKGR